MYRIVEGQEGNRAAVAEVLLHSRTVAELVGHIAVLIVPSRFPAEPRSLFSP